MAVIQETPRQSGQKVGDEGARIAVHLLEDIQEELGRDAGFLAQTTAHVLSSPGKMLRPLLMLEACRAAGGDPDLAFPAAVGTEYGHIASLIHDDIIDGDAERRGQAALHVQFDPGAAILTGDFLIFHTFLCYARCRDRGASAERVLAAITTLSTTCLEMCRGQAMEASMVGRLEVSEGAYLTMIRLKTAGVCGAAARIGASLGGAAEDAVLAVGEYGTNLGMAFQIVDDILSYSGDAALVGKPLHSDAVNGRVTLPIIYACATGGSAVRREIARAFDEARDDYAAAHARLVACLRETGALERSRTVARSYSMAAKHALDRLPRSEAREHLCLLVDLMLDRTR